jgi:hypothetical protein
MPGVAVGEAFDNKNKGLLAGVDISFSGAPADSNQWQVNGANNNDLGSQRTILIYPSVDAIQEFKILRNSYGPEYGGAGGAQINLVTKAGGNQFHGDVYYFGRNDKLNAENFFLGAVLSCLPVILFAERRTFCGATTTVTPLAGPSRRTRPSSSGRKSGTKSAAARCVRRGSRQPRSVPVTSTTLPVVLAVQVPRRCRSTHLPGKRSQTILFPPTVLALLARHT